MPRLSDRLKRRRSRASAAVESLETRTLLAAAPVLGDVGGTRSFTEGGPPVPVDADLTITSPDIRAGMALLLAALCAEGTTVIRNISQIDRGYEDVEGKLRSLGAKIERLTDE